MPYTGLDFYTRLSQICKERGTSITAYLTSLGKSQSAGTYMKGKDTADMKLVAKAARHFNVSPDWLLGATDERDDIEKIEGRSTYSLDARESALIEGIRSAPKAIRDTVYTMSLAALGALVPDVAASAVPEPIFSSSNGGNVSHAEASDTVLKAYPKLAQLGVRKGMAPGTYKPVQGKVAAGPPIAAVREDERRIAVPIKYTGEQYFIVQVDGDSMPGVANDGDYCVINKDGLYDNGRVVLVQVDGKAGEPDATLKRVYRRPGNKVELRSENPKYKPMIYPVDEVLIMGELVAVLPPDSCVLPAR